MGGLKKLEKKCVNPRNVAPPIAAYSHVVEVSSRKLLFIAGQVAVDEQGHLVGKGDFKAQTDRVFRNLQLILSSFGASFSNVVKLTTFVTDIGNRPVLSDVRSRYIKDEFPASTLVEVAALAQPEYMIEIEAVAAVD
jgi:reactive intermediate/imine deaminase